MTINTNPITVHHEGQEGAIQIDRLTGIVIPSEGETPEWANGLTCALLNERYAFYFGNEKLAARLDKGAHEATIMNADIIDFQDLSWVAVDEEQNPVELEASENFRMNRVAELSGFDRTNFDKWSEEMDMQIAGDVERTDAEAETLTEMQGADFSKTAEANAATGT